jgi:putative ABC transport system ATP-binding protein
MIEVKNVTKTYGKKENTFTALDNVSFSVEDGATVAIVGKSGSGKSTLMHIMSGLDHPTSGEVQLGKRVLSKMKTKQVDRFRATEMSFIFQAFFVEPNQTVFQNVMLPQEIASVGHRDRRKRVTEALEAVELLDKADNKAKDLSGGQKQRLAIARAIVNKPTLIFADEPTGNLDSTTGDKIIDLLFSLNKNLGSTLIIVTHDNELAERCEMQVFIKDGKIERVRRRESSAKKKAGKK